MKISDPFRNDTVAGRLVKHRSGRRFRAFRQHGATDCGIVCLAMILRHHGLPDLCRTIAQEAAHAPDGSSLADLADAARRYGFDAHGWQPAWEELPELRLPLLLHYHGNHFVVLYSIGRGHVRIADPLYGKARVSRADFLCRWTGVALELEPTRDPDLAAAAAGRLRAVPDTRRMLYRNFYRPVLRPLLPLLLRILAATAALQLLGLALPLFTRRIIDDALPDRDSQLLRLVLCGMAAVFVVQVVLLSLRNLLLLRLRASVEHAFFSRFFNHLLNLRQPYFDSHRREDLVARFQENLNIRQLVNPAMVENLVDLLFILLYVPVLLWMNLRLGLLTCGLVAAYALLTAGGARYVSRLAHKVFRRNIESLGSFLDALLGVKTIRLLGIREAAFAKWRSEYTAAVADLERDERRTIAVHSMQRALHLFSQLAVFWIGGYMCFRGEISIGTYLAITSVFLMVLASLFGLSGIWYNITELWTGVGRVNDVLMQEPERTAGTVPDTGLVCLRDVSFRYRASDPRDVLSGLSVSFGRGETIGIVGRNGCGKSTLMQLLLGFYPDYRGQILFGGTELRDADLGVLRKRVFLFPQDVHIFNATIRENIRYGNAAATDEDLERAIDLAGLRDFIDAQFLGLEHRLGDSGGGISGGQRIRIGFARLFLASPEIIILDEASSLLDAEAERRILENIRARFPDAALLSIAHRIHTLRHADRIWFIEDGRIVEDGPHDGLMRSGGRYAALMSASLEL